MTSKRPRTVGELSASGYQVRPVREEMRRNLIRRIRRRRGALPGHHRLRGHGHSATGECDPLRAGRHLPRRKGPGEVPPYSPAGEPARRCHTGRRRLRDQRQPVRSDLSRAAATGRREQGDELGDRLADARRSATARSWPRRTSPSPTSSARSTRSRWPRGATFPTR